MLRLAPLAVAFDPGLGGSNSTHDLLHCLEARSRQRRSPLSTAWKGRERRKDVRRDGRVAIRGTESKGQDAVVTYCY